MKQVNQWICCLLAVMLLVAPLQNVVHAEEKHAVWHGEESTAFDGGSGTLYDPYRIATAEQLAYFSSTVNSGTTYKGIYIALVADICLNNIDDFDNWDSNAPKNNWIPIGKSSGTAFSGIFDGENHTIRGMYISTDGQAGLFGTLKDSTVTDLIIDNSYVKGSSAAGLAANISMSSDAVAKISNVTFNGCIEATGTNAGGIFGKYEAGSFSSCPISKCKVYGSISGTSCVGGIGGTGGTLSECVVYADISGSESKIGGIVGTSATVADCAVYGSVKGDTQVGGVIGYKGGGYNIVAISRCSNNATVTGNSQVGGIMGYGWSGPIIDECYNTGTVTGTSKVAGIVGHLSTAGAARNCYNIGSITAQNYIGGIVGHCQYNGAGATLCYNAGTVTGNAICGGTDYGGSVSSCYYLQGSGTSGRGTALSESAMGNTSSFSSFDFSTVWTMNAAAGRPILKNNLELMQDVSCQVLVLDVNTGEAIVGAHVEYDGSMAITDSNGIAVITVPGQYFSSNYALVVSKLGYEDFICYLSDLDVDFDMMMSNTILCVPIDDITDAEAAQNIYTNEHISFYLGGFSTVSDEYGFYNTVWQHEDGKRLWACYTWDVLGNIGEVLSLKFDDLTITADVYELYVADLVLSMAESQALDETLVTRAADAYSKCYTNFSDNFLNNLVAILEEDQLLQEEIEDLLAAENIPTPVTELLSDEELFRIDLEKILKGESISINTGTKIIYEKVTAKALTDNSLFSQLFAGFSAANKIASLYTDTIVALSDVGNACILAASCRTVNEEYFKILEAVYFNMLDDENLSGYAWEYMEAVNKYYNIATDEDALRWYLLFERDKALLKCAYNNMWSELVKAEAYKRVSSALGIGVPQLQALVGTYNGTYKLLDKITQLSNKSEQYYIMSYVGPVEKAMEVLLNSYGERMVNMQDYNYARKFDLAYQLLRRTNKYLYESAYNFAALRKDAEEMQYSTYYKNAWNLNNCHNNYVIDRSKYISIQCPVDVYLYDSDGNLIVAIVDEEIVAYNDETVTVVVCDGKKSLMFLADNDYSVEIVSRDSGSMEYYISEADDVVAYRNVEFYDLSLKEGQLYKGDIPCEFGIPNAEYTLVTDSNDMICDYDSMISDACADGHNYEEWITVEESTCVNDGLKIRYCNTCSKKEKTIVHNATGHNYKETITAPTCSEQGYTTHTCSNCGDSYMDSYVDATGHTPAEAIIENEVAASCGMDGHYDSVVYCVTCKEELIRETYTIPATGDHNYCAVVTAPTCTERGYTTHICGCGDTYCDSYRDAMGHIWKGLGCVRCDANRDNPFSDTDPAAFYFDAVIWAVEKGITTGTTPTMFSPNGECLRGHVVTFLWRAAGSPEPKTNANPFADVSEVDYFYKAVLWAVEEGITNGTSATTFSPAMECNRAQVVTFLYRTMGEPSVSTTECDFTDVTDSYAFYYNAVLWAVENDITNGMGDGTFGVVNTCNRAQVVTFLYRIFR